MKVLNQLFSILVISSLIACGGGGGGDDPVDPPANQAPNSVAPADFSSVEGSTVSLNGTGSNDSDGSISSYAWSQTAGSPSVTLNNASMATASFTAPTVNADTQLTFQLTVTDNDGDSDSDTVVVTISPDQAPSAVAGADFDAVGASSVNLDGTGSSDDVEISSYLWEQTDGEQVTLSNASTATASFTAPAFDPNQAKVLTFRLTVTDSVGASDTDTVVVTVVETPSVITLSGAVSYDQIPFNTATNGLNYNSISQQPARGVTVELLNAGNSSIIESSMTDASGNYSFDVTPNASYVVRVKAEYKQVGGSPSWDFTVVDNTSNDAVYAMDSATQAVANQPVVLNLNAASGWTGSSYGATRVAGPYSILDAVYQSVQKIISVDSTADFPALKLHWSASNVNTQGSSNNACINYDGGTIGTSFYTTNPDCPGIYILGGANSDTDEYDKHVLIHEWGHYFEDKFSRSDSLGGSHSGTDKLDMRVAMGEGYGNALSGIVTDDPFYRDSFGNGQSQGFDIDVEDNPSSNQGWFAEFSVQSLLYDIYDSTNDGADNVSLGFGPIYEALVGGQRTTEALTTIFSLANQIKAESPANAVAIDTLLASQQVIAADDFGTTETNNGGDARNLPIYKSISIGGGSVEVCSYGSNGQYNKLGNRQFLVFDVATAGSYNFTASGQGAGDDPDIVVYNQGATTFRSNANGNESTTQSLSAGKYVMEAYEFTNIEGTVRDTCIDVTITSN